MSSFFADEYKQKEIAPVETWGDLGFNELLETRDLLVARQEYFVRNPQIWRQIQMRLDYLSELISQKSK